MTHAQLLTRSSPSLKQRLLVLALVMIVSSVLMVDPVFAQALDPVVKTSNIFRDTMIAICLSILTIAWGVAGYKIAFNGASFRDMGGPIIGGALSGSAAVMAAAFIT
jgi:TrbC/VIRB2 pilin